MVAEAPSDLLVVDVHRQTEGHLELATGGTTPMKKNVSKIAYAIVEYKSTEIAASKCSLSDRKMCPNIDIYVYTFP